LRRRIRELHDRPIHISEGPPTTLQLFTGLFDAARTGLVSSWFLRRRFAVKSIAAGLAGGALGDLAGVIMLELHRNDFQACT
jgi:hypothetical protein